MLIIPGKSVRLCDGVNRRDFLRVGGSSLLGLSLAPYLQRRAEAAKAEGGGGKHPPSFGKAKAVILLYLQGGPSHIDIWDPKPDAPENVRGLFTPRKTKIPGCFIGEHMPKTADILDKATLIRSVSYRPKGLFNHTAAMYQMLTGYTPDKVSPTGQLEPPSPNDFPNFGSHIINNRPVEIPMLPFVMMPRPLQESNIIGKAGTAGFLGRKLDPYYLYQDPNKEIKVTDLELRKEVSKLRLQRRASLRSKLEAQLPELERAVEASALNEYYGKAFELLIGGRARQAFDLSQEKKELRDKYGRHTFGQGALLARRLIEAGTRFVQLNWPAVANGNPTIDAWDTHASNFDPLKNLHCPKLDSALSSLITDLDDRGMLDETLVLAIGEFGRSPRMGVSTSGNGNAPDGRDHWPYCYTGFMAGGGIKRGYVYGKSDATASTPAENPVHPTEILATVYHAIGVDHHQIVYNLLDQPRDMLKGEPVMDLFG